MLLLDLKVEAKFYLFSTEDHSLQMAGAFVLSCLTY